MFNSHVTSKQTGVFKENEFNSKSGASMKLDRYKQKQAEELQAVTESAMDLAIVQENRKIADERVGMKKILESQSLRVSNSLYAKGRELLFIDMVSEAYQQGLWLDESFVAEQSSNLHNVVYDYVMENGGYSLLDSSIERTNSPFLKKMKSLCEATARKVSTRKLQEMKEGKELPSDAEFELTSDEKTEYDYDKGNIGIDQVSSIVKDKVLNTVKHEKAKEEKDVAFDEDITNMNDTTNENPKDEPTKESASLFKMVYEGEQADNSDVNIEDDTLKEILDECNCAPGGNGENAIVIEFDKNVREHTLFSAIMQSTLKESVLSSVATFGASDDEEDDENRSTAVSLKQANSNEYPGDTNIEDEMNAHPSVGNDINMDLILAESVAKYTLLETAHTLGLSEFTTASIKKMSNDLVYKKK